ncbi:hypothetical protein D9613_012843 [Agrocybe pediades]|uniref:Uncharacterized protein n=1 Tax=Agrocybe pediades TaxID=84607 RepID=A0A8H4QW74_9AGAR|nr:hypothetical protein D9613_012843 [Agrocybe pediades]
MSKKAKLGDSRTEDPWFWMHRESESVIDTDYPAPDISGHGTVVSFTLRCLPSTPTSTCDPTIAATSLVDSTGGVHRTVWHIERMYMTPPTAPRFSFVVAIDSEPRFQFNTSIVVVRRRLIAVAIECVARVHPATTLLEHVGHHDSWDLLGAGVV